jgi:hypothetical protein
MESTVSTTQSNVGSEKQDAGSGGQRQADIARILKVLEGKDDTFIAVLADRLEMGDVASEAERTITIIEPEEDDSTAPDFSPDSARGELKIIAEWLARRTPQEKLTAVLLDTLTHGDVSLSLENRDLYTGDIGRDLERAWDGDVTALMRDPAAGEDAVVAAYCQALSMLC